MATKQEAIEHIRDMIGARALRSGLVEGERAVWHATLYPEFCRDLELPLPTEFDQQNDQIVLETELENDRGKVWASGPFRIIWRKKDRNLDRVLRGNITLGGLFENRQN